ncbi:MAG: hypothetical protein N4A38_01465 [Candidatus Gracilibacteria bacterium]|nr:hypothetical protein [Candidatus Gracilibacteria bacterium]
MVSNNKKNQDINALIEENNQLKKKLEVAKAWMEREVKSQVHKVAKRKVGKMTEDLKHEFLNENIEEVISKRIADYFGELLLLNAPQGTVEAITTSEINFYNMQKNPTIDGFSVISGYHKTLDLFIENFIVKQFRKYAKKQKQTILRTNDPLEKSLNLVVNKGYILSTGRLYGLLRLLKEDGQLNDYSMCFRDYLNKYVDLKDVLLSDNFFDNFTKLNKSEVLGSKRHKGSITKDETILARDILIGNFKNQDSILYKLLESQSVIF